MSDASGSGERKSIGEKTHISLRSATLIMIGAVIPLTMFVASLYYGQQRMNDKIDALIQSMDIRRVNRDKEIEGINKRLDKHDERIQELERKRP